MSVSNEHYENAMRHALSLALQGEGRTGANPIVGAVILDADGLPIAEGFHAGGDHAEVVAIKSLPSIPAGSTIVVTLEPCNHTGKTGPCTDAIIAAGISRVVYAVSDPNPIAAGGADKLREAGIEVISGVLEVASRFFNRAWLSVIEKKRPIFIWKIAATLDGKTAAVDGTSQWITSESSREFVSLLRRNSDAIMVGTGTVIADNPSLVPHDGNEIKNPLRVVMGVREIPVGSQVLDDQAELLQIKSHDFDELISALMARGIKQVFLEAGSELGTAMLTAGLIDEIMLFQAPTILGTGRSFIGDLGISTLDERFDLGILAHRQIGNDLFTHMKVGK
jgi:diaminohydroxyphosphoribosylaminopyrimidine deaminase/5-amino-6-(5-phosphoribosylamino)uracil reductase